MYFASSPSQRGVKLKEPRGKQGLGCWAKALGTRMKISNKYRVRCILLIVKGLISLLTPLANILAGATASHPLPAKS
jgi:hypothetical protein